MRYSGAYSVYPCHLVGYVMFIVLNYIDYGSYFALF